MNILKRDANDTLNVADYKRAIANATNPHVLARLKTSALEDEFFSEQDKRAISDLIARRYGALNRAALGPQTPRFQNKARMAKEKTNQ